MNKKQFIVLDSDPISGLELVELGGLGTKVMCPLRHLGSSVRILRPKKGRLPIMHWY